MIIVIGLIILGVDRYIVQPRTEPATPSAAIDSSPIRIKRELPTLDLGLDAQVERTHEKLDRLREARERERKERQASPDSYGNSVRDRN
ncbi:hypothetical protein AY599_18050 [Leptolyngbya valderiana BDU 20041]|nr:hypothetical protein AY599_18050 [Leptolyngbya valderiana BDU 20041]